MTLNAQWERYTTPRNFKSGETIFRQGDPGDAIYIVSSGQVVITKETPDGDPVVLGYRDQGAMFGEISIIADTPRTASVSAVGACTLQVMTRDDFWRIMHADQDFQQVVMKTLIDRLLLADETRVTANLWERQLYERFSSLADENEQMAEVMQLRHETMHFIVHDLRNPIGLAQTALEMIRLGPDYDEASDTARFVMMAVGGLQRMLHLVDSLLDLERLDEGESALALEAIDIVAMIDELVERQQPMAWTTNVRLVTRTPPVGYLPVVRADRHRIERVLNNLLDNALKFTPPEGQVTVSAERDGDNLLVAVNDTGSGIPADQRSRVFDRFVQTEEGRKVKGFGLGLAFCRSAVEAHGGAIRAVEGDGGKGTKITFTLPLAG
jgi:signal transduction histidine kinase